MNMVKNDAKRVFLKKGTCSQTLCFLLDREFDNRKENEERASDPLAGGLMQTGQQCGMLWGAALGVGAESFRRHDRRDQAVGAAMTATRDLVDAFLKTAKSVNCRDIIGCDFSGKSGMWKALLLGRFTRCFRLVAAWAPEAIRAAEGGLSREKAYSLHPPLSCASEVARKMGASDEEMVMVAGFAGGIGLSGNACGALGAAIWMKTLAWCKAHPGKTPPYFSNPFTKDTLKAFNEATGSEMLCCKIAGRRFGTIDEHGEFIRNGGCDTLIDVLARS
jgi:hypothetical protein